MLNKEANKKNSKNTNNYNELIADPIEILSNNLYNLNNII